MYFGNIYINNCSDVSIGDTYVFMIVIGYPQGQKQLYYLYT